MSAVETFERKALFNITRIVALICVSVFLLSTVGIAIYGTSVWNAVVPTKVSPDEIIQQIKPPPAPASDAAKQPQGAQPPTDQGQPVSPLAGYRIPFALQKYISGDDAQIIKNHLDDVPVDERQSYVDELGAVVSAAEVNKVDAVDAINAYMKTKAERYQRASAENVRKWETMKFVAGGIAAGLLLIALFSLVLVLLAIERNTRGARPKDTVARTVGETSAKTA